MASNPNLQMNPLEQALSFFGIGDSGVQGSMSTGSTVPTGFNTSPNWAPPGVESNVGNGMNTGLGANLGTGQLALSGLASLAGLWGSLQNNKLAKEQFKFQKDFANTNLNNQIKSYNTALSDRLSSRGVAEGRTDEYTQDKINQNRLSR